MTGTGAGEGPGRGTAEAGGGVGGAGGRHTGWAERLTELPRDRGAGRGSALRHPLRDLGEQKCQTWGLGGVGREFLLSPTPNPCGHLAPDHWSWRVTQGE